MTSSQINYPHYPRDSGKIEKPASFSYASILGRDANPALTSIGTTVGQGPAMGFFSNDNNSGENWRFEITLICILTALIYAITRINKRRRYFQERNVPCVESVSILGSSPGTTLFRHMSVTWTEIYRKLAPHKIGGFYELFLQRFYMVCDPEYAQLVFVNNFAHFTDRGFHVDVDTNPMDDNIFFLQGAKWRYLRNKLSPIFTTSSLKWMTEEMENCANRFLVHFEKHVPQNEDVDLQEMTATCTLQVLASTVFGLESNILHSSNNKFREVTKLFFTPSIKTGVAQFFRFSHPALLKFFKFKTVDSEVTDFFLDIIRTSFKIRTETNFSRKDIIQLLLELYRKGSIASEEKGENSEEQNSSEVKIEITEELMAAQAFIFYMAGFETTASTIYNLIYFLSVNPVAQEKLKQEILTVKERHGGITFESFKEMKYLDFCIMETLRILPPLPFGFRECTKDFTFPNGIKVQNGDLVVIPVCAIQNDPQYYPKPNSFIPERFENPPPKGTYYPFGEGPRICVGKRFAELDIKMITAKLLEKFSFHPSDRDCTTDVLTLRGVKANTILMYPRDGFIVKVKKN